MQDIVMQAQALLQQGRAHEAVKLLEPIVSRPQPDLMALRLYGFSQLRCGETEPALQAFTQLVQRLPDEAEAHKDIGVVQAARGELVAAEASLQTALRLDPGSFLARLHLGRVLQRLGREDEAVLAYFGALHRAQSAGRWRNDATTPPLLRELVRQAMDTVDAGRRRVFEHALAPVYERHGSAAMARVEDCLAHYLSERIAEIPDPQQQPLFLYFPGLPSTRYFARDLFPWAADLERETPTIRGELQNLMTEQGGFVPFLGNATADEVRGQLAGTRGTPAWNAFFFYRHGERYDDNCARCPRTAQILDSLPLVRIREHAPEICFSVLTPGSHILPHTGVTNTRVVCHLPLIVPEECAIVVGGERHDWQEGRVMVFDDTFEHEAWNRSTQTRVILLMDTWNPHLTEAERDAVAVLVGAVGDFHSAAGVKQP